MPKDDQTTSLGEIDSAGIIVSSSLSPFFFMGFLDSRTSQKETPSFLIVTGLGLITVSDDQSSDPTTFRTSPHCRQKGIFAGLLE